MRIKLKVITQRIKATNTRCRVWLYEHDATMLLRGLGTPEGQGLQMSYSPELISLTEEKDSEN